MQDGQRRSLLAAYRQASIKTQLLTVLCALTAMIFLIILILYGNASKREHERSNQEISAYVDEIGRSIDSKCESFDRMLTLLSFDEVIQNFVTADQTDAVNWIDRANELSHYMKNIVALNPDIIDIILMDSGGMTYGLNRNYRLDNPKIQENLQADEQCHYSEVIDINTRTVKWKGILVSTRISSIDPHLMLRDVGAAALVIRPESIGLSEAARFSTYPVQLFVTDRCGKVFSSGNGIIGDGKAEELVSSMRVDSRITVNGVRYMAYVRHIGDMEGTLLALVEEDSLFSGIRSTRSIAIILLLLSIVCIIFFSRQVLRGIIAPLHTLRATMDKISDTGEGEEKLDLLKENIDLVGCSEVREIAYGYNHMMHTIDDLTETILRKDNHILQVELARKQAQLSFLQSQTNPHFLCNAFDSIKGLAAQHHDYEIRSAASDLAAFFRYSLCPGDQVSLREELDAVDRYIRIQQMRFGNRFSVNYRISDESFRQTSLRMILQPLVENAIVHGIESLERPCVLTIGAEVARGILTLWVQDNGTGIPNETMLRLQFALEEGNSPPGSIKGYRSGIGVINVHNRIRLQYGDGYGIQIVSRINEGTKVTLTMPAVEYPVLSPDPMDQEDINVQSFDN